jgi:hypothetical protein
VLGQGRFVIPLTVFCMSIALAVMAYYASRRGKYWPLLPALLGAGVVIATKFAAAPLGVTVAGALLLAAASVWSAWPTQSAPAASEVAGPIAQTWRR